MSVQRFKIGQQFCWNHEYYEVRQLLPGNKLRLVSLRTNEGQLAAFIELYQALLASKLQFVLEKGQAVSQKRPSNYIDLADCPQELLAVARYRLDVIEPLLGLSGSQRRMAIKERVAELQQSEVEHNLLTAISEASIYRWLRDYSQSGNDLRALIPNTQKRGGKKVTRLNPTVEHIIKVTLSDLVDVDEVRTTDYIHREIAVRIAEENQQRKPQDTLKLPSRATVGRRIQNTDGLRWVGRRTEVDLRQYEATPYPTTPLARVEIDHTRSDIVIIDDTDLLPLGRLTLTYALDTATRYPLGYYQGFEPPSYLAVMACLYHTILPKNNVRQQYGTQHAWLAHGIPFTLVVDNGREFVGRDLDDSCQLLNIVLERMPPHTPHFKAAVERMFGTTNSGIFYTLPGAIFARPGQQSRYDSWQQACLSLGELDQIMHLFLVDIYAEDFHRGLGGIPARHWAEATRNGFFPRVPASAEELRILLGRIAYRTIQPYGVELFSLRYNCTELTPLRTRLSKCDHKQVKVKYNPADLSCIYVYDAEEKQYIEVPALAQAYTQGLSLWKHRVIRNFVLNEQRSVDIVALGRAQRKIQAIVEQSMTHKKVRGRARIARWQNKGPLTNGSQADPTPSATTDTPVEAIPPPTVEVDLSKLEQEGWGFTEPWSRTTKQGGHDEKSTIS